MSTRKAVDSQTAHAKQLQKELKDLKSASIEAVAADGIAQETAAGEVPTFDSLTRTEQAAASLGVAPDSWSKLARDTGRCTLPTAQ